MEDRNPNGLKIGDAVEWFEPGAIADTAHCRGNKIVMLQPYFMLDCHHNGDIKAHKAKYWIKIKEETNAEIQDM